MGGKERGLLSPREKGRGTKQREQEQSQKESHLSPFLQGV